MTTLFQVLCSNCAPGETGNLTDQDLAHLAAWAHERAKKAPKNLGIKRGYSLIREGADLLLRASVLHRAIADEWTSKNPSIADLTQDPTQSTQGIHDKEDSNETVTK